MATRASRAILALVLALTLTVPLARSAEAAAPRLMMVYGGGLAEPVVIDDWQENLDFLLATSDPIGIPSAELVGRSYLSLALFWGPEWDRYVAEGGSIAVLRPEQANQHGRFYPAWGTRQALLTLSALPGPGSFARRADSDAAEVLLRHGIPAGPIAVPVGAGFTLGALAALPARPWP